MRPRGPESRRGCSMKEPALPSGGRFPPEERREIVPEEHREIAPEEHREIASSA